MSEDTGDGDLEARLAALPDSELLRIVGTDRDEYRAEALRIARAEVTRRGLAVPEAPVLPAAAEKPFGRISPLTKGLLGLASAYTLAAKLVPDMSDYGVRLSPSLGVGLVGAMLWSMAWDMRVRSAETSGRMNAERAWHKGLLFWASVVTLAAVYFGVRELRH